VLSWGMGYEGRENRKGTSLGGVGEELRKSHRKSSGVIKGGIEGSRPLPLLIRKQEKELGGNISGAEGDSEEM